MVSSKVEACGLGRLSPIEECEKVQDAQARYQSQVDLGHQTPLGGMSGYGHLLVVR